MAALMPAAIRPGAREHTQAISTLSFAHVSFLPPKTRQRNESNRGETARILRLSLPAPPPWVKHYFGSTGNRQRRRHVQAYAAYKYDAGRDSFCSPGSILHVSRNLA